jgi:CRP-like cAMP-binding protein
VTVGVSYDTPPNLVREVILGVVRDVPHVRSEPAPWVNLVSYADFSVNFTIKFYIDDFPRLDEIQSILLDRLWYAFRREKIDIPFPVRDVRIRPAAEAAAPQSGPPTAATLRRVDLFQSLAPHEVEQLAGSARRQVFGKGEILCRQGEEGGTLYAICSGGVSITVRQTDGRETVVAHLGPDAFFGEMSLLTGEKRSATVTAERDTEVLMVSKTALAPLLESNTDLASRLAEAVEHRTADRLARMNADTAAVATSSHSALVQRIRRFFGLG